jgi:hypothetical protein
LTVLAGTGVHPVARSKGEARVALVIGNSAYPDADTPLKDPVNSPRSGG